MSEPLLSLKTTLEVRSPVSAALKADRPASFLDAWRYVDMGSTRDLRIDFMRGFVFLLLFSTHFDYFSWFSLIGWERVGAVSSAETFIMLAGIVTGSVYGKKFKSEGLSAVIIKLFTRAWTLYKTALLVIASVALLHLVPGLDTQAITSFTDDGGQVFALYPAPEKGFMFNLVYILALKAGPHQFQVIGLYMVLFLLTPILFCCIERQKVPTLLLLSWIFYLFNYLIPETEPGTAEIRLTGAEFEFAFPLVAWQLLFVHGVIAGYYRKEVLAFFSTGLGRALVALCAVLSVVFVTFALNHPLDKMPDWAKLSVIAPETFDWWYQHFFLKYNLGPGRLLNNVVLMVTVYALLTMAWKPIDRALGWLFIPLGRESMYVFFVHVYLIMLVANTSLPKLNNVWVNTGIHLGVLLLCWAMVRSRFLFRWIPR